MSVPTPDPEQPDLQPPDQPSVQATFCATLVDEWARAGVTDAVVCPGSRSTPLALALARDPRVHVHVRLDERSAGFFALGASLATGRAVVVCTTSGTAAAELHAAVTEAYHAGVPLLICTANRPPRLQSVGAPQVIDQSGLYGSAVLWTAAPGLPDWSERGTWRSLGSRAAAESLHGPVGPGPVHLDLAFDEPLSGVRGQLPAGRPEGVPWHDVARLRREGSSRTTPAPPGMEALRKAVRVLVVAGSGAGSPEAVLGAAEALGAPVLADPLSGCRTSRLGVIAAADALLRIDALAASLRPDLVIRLGGLHASKVLATRLHEWSIAGTSQLLVNGRWYWPDPDRDAGTVVVADPATWCEEVRDHLAGVGQRVPQRGPVRGPVRDPERDPERDRRKSDPGWLERWVIAESAAQETIGSWSAAHGEATEPGIARCLLEAGGSDTTFVVASSMPVRDLEWYAPTLDNPPRVLANRGANGIDGVVSTALGAASAGDSSVVALVGDLAFFHDLTAWVAPSPSLRPSLTVVVVDNGGGGIFSFLPQRTSLDHDTFEELFGTPMTADVAAVARGLGLDVKEVSTIADLTRAVGESISAGATTVVRVKVPGRDLNVEHHADLNAEVERRLNDSLARAD
jgi:2-succinyl-5-enolpyruvyl-6-hydroxy-3-cyclohexene-1-carboxylate synthase